MSEQQTGLLALDAIQFAGVGLLIVDVLVFCKDQCSRFGFLLRIQLSLPGSAPDC